LNSLYQKVTNTLPSKVIYIDLFDTIIHRTVHPNYCIKLWAKFVIREFGLKITPDELFIVRKNALGYIAKNLQCSILEVSYQDLVLEIYERLRTNNLLKKDCLKGFTEIFNEADYKSEIAVQFTNKNTVNTLKQLKIEGYTIYLITDFYLSKDIICKILNFHEIASIFDDIYVSSDLNKSKARSSIYQLVLEVNSHRPEEVIMIGDDNQSDIINAAKFGIRGIRTKNIKHHFRNKRRLFGNNQKDFNKICRETENRCSTSNYTYSEYIIHFYFFTERLYQKAKEAKIKNLFFLSREGLYLKKLFDHYNTTQINVEPINSHYLKISRKSAQLVTLKPLQEEKFENFREQHVQMSGIQLLKWLRFPDVIIEKIKIAINGDLNHIHTNIFTSELMEELRQVQLFGEYYEQIRVNQKNGFNTYLNSFKVDIETEGIHLVDVGWGGTMQENLYKFLKKEIPVTGYYLGLKSIYNIENRTKRYGLNFSIYPSTGFTDSILKANGQLYEQLLSANHGSTVGYHSQNKGNHVIEDYEKSEKYVYDNYIKDVQDYMFKEYKILLEDLNKVVYSYDSVQNYMTDMALRLGIFTGRKKIKFIEAISDGFYQNVGENKVGLSYSPKQLRSRKRHLLKLLIISPEKVFRFLVKLKPYMHDKGLYWLSFPLNLIYYYIKFNFWLKKKIFSKRLLDG